MKRYIPMKSFLRTVAFTMLFAVNNIAFSTEAYVSEAMMNNIHSRSVGFEFLRLEERERKVTEFLENHEMVEGYTLHARRNGIFEEKGCTLAEYMPEVIGKYMDGRKVDLQGNQAVIAKYFYYGEDDASERINMESYIGQTIEIDVQQEPWRALREPGTKSFEIEIVDVYDNIEAGEENVLYLSDVFMEDLATFVEDIEEGDKERGEYLTQRSSSDATVVLKDYSQIDIFCEEFNQVLKDESDVTLKFWGGPITLKDSGGLLKRNEVLESSRTVFKAMVVIFNVAGMLVLGGVLINVTYQTKTEIRKNYYDIGIMKAIGYRNRDIAKLYLAKYMKTIFRELIVTFLFGSVCIIFMCRWLKVALDIFADADIGLHMSGVLLMIVVIPAAVLWGFVIEMWNVNKISPMEALKTVE